MVKLNNLIPASFDMTPAKRKNILAAMGGLMGIAMLLLPTTLWATDDISQRYGPGLTQCYEAASDATAKADCIGVFAGNCISREDGTGSLPDMAQCTLSETKVWDGSLNVEYGLTMEWMDKNKARIHYGAKLLKEAQRAWLVLRDAQCQLESAAVGKGHLGYAIEAECFMQMTAKRAIKLYEIREMSE